MNCISLLAINDASLEGEVLSKLTFPLILKRVGSLPLELEILFLFQTFCTECRLVLKVKADVEVWGREFKSRCSKYEVDVSYS